MTSTRLATTLALLILLWPIRASAQDSRLSLTADAVVGGGERTRFSGTSWFRGSSTKYGRVSVALVGPPIHRIRPLLTVDQPVVLEGGDEVAMCQPAPDGSCYRHFPRDAGLFLGAGLRAAATQWADIGLAAGTGSMGGSSRYVEGDIALRVATHVRLLTAVRRVTIHDRFGGHLWWHPVAAGLRIQ